MKNIAQHISSNYNFSDANNSSVLKEIIASGFKIKDLTELDAWFQSLCYLLLCKHKTDVCERHKIILINFAVDNDIGNSTMETNNIVSETSARNKEDRLYKLSPYYVRCV